MVFHKIQMYATHIIVVMEPCVKCMCYSTNAFESQGTLISKPLMMNKIHYFFGSNLVHVHAKCVNYDMWQNEHVFPILNFQVEAHPKSPTLKHIGIPLQYT
jgi:hypothetical protein